MGGGGGGEEVHCPFDHLAQLIVFGRTMEQTLSSFKKEIFFFF